MPAVTFLGCVTVMKMCQYQQIQELRSCQETNSYRHQFEHAQQMLRENQAELSEIRGLFADLQTTAHKQV